MTNEDGIEITAEEVEVLKEALDLCTSVVRRQTARTSNLIEACHHGIAIVCCIQALRKRPERAAFRWARAVRR